MSSAKRRLVIVLPPMLVIVLPQMLVIVLPQMLRVPSWSSKASVMIFSRNMLKRVGEIRHPFRTPTVVRNQSPYAADEKDRTNGLVTEVLDDSDKIGADVVPLHGHPQSCMPNPVKGLLESVKTW